jgi:hypothetical protein
MEDDTVSNGKGGHIDPVPSGSAPPARPIFYISGSPTQVAAAQRALIEAGVEEHDIQVENLAGAAHSGTDESL